MSGKTDFESLVNLYYIPLYRFALSLAHKESDACDLTQQTFYIWATKGHQLQEAAKVKTWLFTTMHRLFLETNRKQNRFPHHELDSVSEELPAVNPGWFNQLDSMAVLKLLGEINPLYQPPVALFYLEEHSYKEIAEILEIPLGTVKSRISRGIFELQTLLSQKERPGAFLGKERV